MIDLHYWPTPNGRKIAIMLEEVGLPYRIIPVDIGRGAQFRPEFLAISPNNRMPAIVDHDPMGGGAPISVFESGAILLYLAEKTGKFMPREPRGKYEVIQWLMWQMGGLGPMMSVASAPTKMVVENTAGKVESDAKESRQMLFEEMKNKMNQLQQMFQALSNVLNAMHQGAMSSIRNIKG